MAARFKLDENIARDVEALLRDAGHDVHSVFDEHLDGGPDTQLLDACRNEKRILITLDLDFADIRLYPPASHAGVWVLRPSMQSIEKCARLVERSTCLARLRNSRAASVDRRA